jgi:aminopeptidase
MALSNKELQKIARNTVANMAIGRKPNPGIAKAKKRFGATFSNLYGMNGLLKKNLSSRGLQVLRKLQDPDYGPLFIERNGKYFTKTEVGEEVRLVYSDSDKDCVKLAKLIMEECWRKGAHVMDMTTNTAESRKHMQLIPFDTAAELPRISRISAETYDARIFLGGDENLYWTRGLEAKIKLGAPSGQKLHDMMDKRGVRWCLFGWPVPRNQYFIKRNEYNRIFLDSIRQTFTPKVKRLCNYYKKALSGGDKVRITAKDGTNLTFSIKGRPILVADGIMDQQDIKNGDVGLNIPDGEVFLAPLEYSANGVITFDFVTVHGYGLVRELKIKFKDGKVVWYDSPQKDTFKKFLDANTGEKDRIAELGIGTNPGAKFVGETIVDEKIFGSVHIAIGTNTGAYHGKNKASSHLDMIKIMKGKGGNMYVDGKIVMKEGMPVGKK